MAQVGTEIQEAEKTVSEALDANEGKAREILAKLVMECRKVVSATGYAGIMNALGELEKVPQTPDPDD